MTDHSLRTALAKPHVKRYYREQLEVLRGSERARNILRAVEIRDESKNHAAAMNAIRYLDQMPDEQATGRGAQTVPGMIVVVNTGTPVGTDVGIDAAKLVNGREISDT
jgi:hypothetical protein